MLVLRLSKADNFLYLEGGTVGYQKKTRTATAQPRDFPGGETRKNIPTKKLIVLQLQVTSASAVRVAVCHPQDNVNIQLEVL